MEQINILTAEKRESEDPFEGGVGKGWGKSSQWLAALQDLVASLGLVYFVLLFY